MISVKNLIVQRNTTVVYGINKLFIYDRNKNLPCKLILTISHKVVINLFIYSEMSSLGVRSNIKSKTLHSIVLLQMIVITLLFVRVPSL